MFIWNHESLIDIQLTYGWLLSTNTVQIYDFKFLMLILFHVWSFRNFISTKRCSPTYHSHVYLKTSVWMSFFIIWDVKTAFWPVRESENPTALVSPDKLLAVLLAGHWSWQYGRANRTSCAVLHHTVQCCACHHQLWLCVMLVFMWLTLIVVNLYTQKVTSCQVSLTKKDF